MPARQSTPAPTQVIARSIVILRGQKVLRRLNAMSVAFRETGALNRSQNVTGAEKHRNIRFPPMAFTEHGAIMAATILKSNRAVEMSVLVVRAFVQLRALLASNSDLARRLAHLEARVARRLTGHDREITAIIELIREMMAPQPLKRRPIGFTADLGDES